MSDKALMDISSCILDKERLAEMNSESALVLRDDLAGKILPKDKTEDTLHFVGFQFGSEEYVIEIQLIQEIIMVGNITVVPHVAQHFEGVINLRGNIVPVINLRLKLNMPPKPIDANSRIIIMELGDMVVGYLVDNITKVIRLPKKNIESTSSSFGGISEEYINGVGRLMNDEGIVGWLNVHKIIEMPSGGEEAKPHEQ